VDKHKSLYRIIITVKTASVIDVINVEMKIKNVKNV